MTEKENMKEKIIDVTTALIEANDGNADHVTARMIAAEANVGLGLINYHFGSKEQLIAICVQRIIGEVISNFDAGKEYSTDSERLTAWAIHVFDFLFEHPAISKISILSDLQDYQLKSNSVFTQIGFKGALRDDMSETNKAFLSFILTASMQVAFLGSETVKELLGYDFSQSADRAKYIEKLISVILKDKE